MNAEEARAAIEQDRQERAQACLAEIQATLEKHSCQLAAIPQFTPDGRVVAEVQVVA